MDTVALVSDKATVSVSVSGPIADPPAPNAVVNVNLYKTVNGYYYYDVNEASESEDDDA